MKTFIRNHNWTKGQVIPIVVLMMFGIIGMVALILDGGMLMSNRRMAQAAADAGALAGAQRICMGASDAKAVAEAYAANNGATGATATISGREVTVNATDENASFFAKIFGQDSISASAEAVAGCYYPSVAQRVLPVAFYYEGPPVNQKNANCKVDGTCNLVNWDFHELMTALTTTPMTGPVGGVGTADQINLPLDNIYVVSESTKVCEKDVSGVIVCSDMSGETSGGNRSFIDLSALDKTATLSQIIQYGTEESMHLPAYLNGQTGVVTAVYQPKNYENFEEIAGYEGFEGRLFFVPVFDKYCDPKVEAGCPYNDDFSDLPSSYDSIIAHDPFAYLVSDNQQSYRLIGFAPFVATCITANEVCQYGDCVPKGEWKLGDEAVSIGNNKDICPGYLALSLQDDEFTKDAIEGYFVDEIPADQYVWGTEGVDVGIYLISLSK